MGKKNVLIWVLKPGQTNNLTIPNKWRPIIGYGQTTPHPVPPFDLSIRKRQRRNPKFFLFDTGVARSLAGTLEQPLVSGTQDYGRAFE